MENQNVNCNLCGISSCNNKNIVIFKINDGTYICKKCNTCLANYNYNIDNNEITPKKIYNMLSNYVISQEESLKEFSSIIYKHYLYFSGNICENAYKKIKTNALIIGPTGVGKTYVAELVSELLNIPIVIFNSSSLTASGYYGDDIDSALESLIKKCDTIEEAEKGIILFDEIDKINIKESNIRGGSDIKGGAVQQEMLKVIGGTEMYVNFNKKQLIKKQVKISTYNILFIGAGCFEGLYDILGINQISGVLNSNSSIGNLNEIESKNIYREGLLKFGFIAEFIGRFGSIIQFKLLSKHDLKLILESDNGKMVSYFSLFQSLNVEIELTEDCKNSMVDYAYMSNTGARSIDEVLDIIFTEHLFNYDNYINTKLIITEGNFINILKNKNKRIHQAKSVLI